MQMHSRKSISSNYGSRDCNTRRKDMPYGIGCLAAVDYTGALRDAATPYRVVRTLRVSRFALVPSRRSLLPRTPPMNSPVLPIGYPWLKVYIAHRQTCPNCSSSCYANDRICYDSARRGSSSTTVSCRSASRDARGACSREERCMSHPLAM